MRVAFAGTPEFARRALEAILAAGHDIVLVLTQPDRPAGRGQHLVPSAVKQAAETAGLQVIWPRGLRLDGRYGAEAQQARAALLAANPQVLVTAAYGLLLPQWLLDLPPLGCLNIHASLLPRWRGAAPIQRAIEAGDATSGVSIMRVDAGLDTGDVLCQEAQAITEDTTAAILHDQLAALGARMIVDTLAQLTNDPAPVAQPQPSTGATYATKLLKSEAPLDWSQPAAVLARRVRAFDPFPGATMRLSGLPEPVKVWQAQALPQPAGSDASPPPGTLIRTTPQGLDVATGQGILRVTVVQKAGGRRVPVASLLQGWAPGGADKRSN